MWSERCLSSDRLALTSGKASPSQLLSRKIRGSIAAALVAGLEPMPTYQYRCEKCGKKFERSETISEHDAVKSKCPKCGSKKVSFVPGNVCVVTSKKS